MTGWGNGVERPWYEKLHPSRVRAKCEEVGWRAEVDPKPASGARRAELHALKIYNADGLSQGLVRFKPRGEYLDGLGHRVPRVKPGTKRDVVGALDRLLAYIEKQAAEQASRDRLGARRP